MGRVDPDTVHFLAQVIRQQRGLLTACEKWVVKRGPSRDGADLGRFIERCRDELSQFELWLGRTDGS